jgi:hypothetical protein
MKAYIAGPMRGIPKYNFPAFDAAAAKYRALGWTIFSPADFDREMGVTEDTDSLPPDFLRKAMPRDLDAICESDMIILLPGWQNSAGVAVELALANLLGLDIISEKCLDKMLILFGILKKKEA